MGAMWRPSQQQWELFLPRKLEQECGVETKMRIVEQRHHAALYGKQAAAQRQTDAVTLALGGKEGDEYLLRHVEGDDVAVIGDREPLTLDPPAPFRGRHTLQNSP